MLDFNRSFEADFKDFGRWIWQQSQQFSTHEQTSQFIASALFEEFKIADKPQLALVRIFRLLRADELPVDLRPCISPDEPLALALTGTYGIEPAWCNRRMSKEHAIIPLSHAAIMQKIPMFQEMLVQLGVKLTDLPDVLLRSDPFRGRFFIPNTVDSPLIPAQANFIRPYGIYSQIGFGGQMRTQCNGHYCLYFLIAFSQVPISPNGALRFYALQDYISTALTSLTGIFS